MPDLTEMTGPTMDAARAEIAREDAKRAFHEAVEHQRSLIYARMAALQQEQKDLETALRVFARFSEEAP